MLSASYSVGIKTALSPLEFSSGAHDLVLKLFSERSKIGVCQTGPGANILVHRVYIQVHPRSPVRGLGSEAMEVN